ncbi:hypothetical protein [Rhodococcus sp. NPDC006774]|uniref:hypothetical protein n=1 Tax=Rhodococcus sp. NPDC006774 TaxID=3157186 RepID=UPI0033CA8571
MPTVTRNSLGAAVTVQLGLPAADDHVPGVVDAVAGLLYRWHDCTLAPENAAVPAESAVWPDDLFRGAVMLAAKLHRRRNTPDGTLANDDYGPVYVARSDPDISMLLRLGKWQQGFAI